MNIQIITVPYDSGYKTTRMGRGPVYLLLHGLADVLRQAGHHVSVQMIETRSDFHTEIATSFELYRLLSIKVQSAWQAGSFPLVLAGNCGSSLGALGGLGTSGLGLIWFDAHGDFNTPETTTSGFLDGMVLAAMTGRCWRALTASIPGFAPLPDAQVLHLGVRDLDPVEKDLLDASGIAVLSAERLCGGEGEHALGAALERLRESVGRVYLHLDLDVLDPAQARANQFSPPGGLTVNHVMEAIAAIKARFSIAAAGVASYDPDLDLEDRTLSAAFRLIGHLAG